MHKCLRGPTLDPGYKTLEKVVVMGGLLLDRWETLNGVDSCHTDVVNPDGAKLFVGVRRRYGQNH